MAVTPKYEVVNFCYWMQNLDWRRLSTTQYNLITTISTAATNQTTVTDQQWKDFNMISNWRYKFYEEWFNYAPFFSGYTAAWLAELPSTPPTWYTIEIDKFICALVNSGCWALLDRLFVFASPSSGIGCVSLVNPTSTDASPSSGITFTPYFGFTGNGSSHYVDSSFNPSTQGTNFTTNSASMGAFTRIQASSASAKAIMGRSDGTNYDILQLRYTGDLMRGIMNSGASDITKSNTITTGLNAVYRNSSTQLELFQNGISLGTQTQSSSARPNATIHLLSRGSADYDTNQISLAFFGSASLSQKFLYSAVYNLSRAIGFNL